MMTTTKGKEPAKSLTEKATAFLAMHHRASAFVIPNPWDPGSARLLAGMGFEALATSSAGYAFSRGHRDGAIGLEEMLHHVAEIVAATDLPTSADLENGYGHAPELVAETIRLASQAGLCGGSIEDSNPSANRELYEIGFATERIRAAAQSCRSLAAPFVLTARAENYLVGKPDLADTIRRLQSYQEAGADVLYAPGLQSLDDIASVVASVDRPVNVVVGLVGSALTVENLSRVGVKRIKLGSTLARAAFGALIRAGREMTEKGTFDFARDAVPYAKITGLLSD